MDASHPTSAASGVPSEEDRALARALVWAYLSSAWRYPGERSLADFVRFEAAVPSALPALDGLGSEAGSRWTALVGTAPCREDRESAYTRLFGHAPEGTCPPYEGQYGESEEGLQMPHELGDIAAFYRAFGLESSTRAKERVDYIAVECEFLSFLCRKQAYGEEIGDATLAAIAVDAQRKFTKEHLGRWVPAFTRRVLQQSSGGFFTHLAHFTLAFVGDECKRLGIQPGADHLRLRVAVPERDGCFDCPQAVGNPAPDTGFAV